MEEKFQKIKTIPVKATIRFLKKTLLTSVFPLRKIHKKDEEKRQ